MDKPESLIATASVKVAVDLDALAGSFQAIADAIRALKDDEDDEDDEATGIDERCGGRCDSHLNVRGEDFRCDFAAKHSGLPHSNNDAEAIWSATS